MNEIILEKGIIYLMLPFRLNVKVTDGVAFENEVWTKNDEDTPHLDFLLDHVKEFFTKNNKRDKPDESACLLLKLRNDALPVRMFNNKNYWLSNKPFDVPAKPEKLIKLAVSIDPASFRIIYHSYTGIAILLFSIELIKQARTNNVPGLADFVRMNYLLRRFGRSNEAFLISQNEKPEERGKAALLMKTNCPPLFPKADSGNPEAGWRPGDLVDYLLCEINKTSEIQFVTPFHFVPFSYFQTSTEIDDESLVRSAIFYLRNVYDFDFTPSPSVLKSDKEVLHPYRQIYFAASIEGSVILNNSGESDPEFIRTYYAGSFRNTLWVVILGLMQRSIFLQLMKEVSDVDPDDHPMIKKYLKRYTRISLKAIFSKISVYHQHNDIYDLIIKELQINELRSELKDELTELNNLERQFHEDEVERYGAVEKQYEKRLNIILFALSVLSLAQITYIIIGDTSLPFMSHLFAIGIPLVLGIVFWNILNIRKK
jgi:hypothetical protein